jgi:hypothetical protein
MISTCVEGSPLVTWRYRPTFNDASAVPGKFSLDPGWTDSPFDGIEPDVAIIDASISVARL